MRTSFARIAALPSVSAIIATIVLAVAAPPAHADILLQTATLGPTGQTGQASGVFIISTQYLAARFQTSQVFDLTDVQIHAVVSTTGNHLLFAAIVPLASLTSFPSSPLIANANPVEVHTFTGTPASSVITIPFSAELPVGTYAVVFGTGEFGTTGTGGAPIVNTDIGTPSYFHTNGNAYINGGLAKLYFVVDGTVGSGAAAPEPDSLLFCLGGALPLLARRSRRREAGCKSSGTGSRTRRPMR